MALSLSSVRWLKSSTQTKPKRNSGFGGGIGFLAMGGDSTFITGGGAVPINVAPRDLRLSRTSFEFAAKNSPFEFAAKNPPPPPPSWIPESL